MKIVNGRPDLNPCPRCKGAPEMIKAMGEFWIDCTGCLATTKIQSNMGAAASQWNNGKVSWDDAEEEASTGEPVTEMGVAHG